MSNRKNNDSYKNEYGNAKRSRKEEPQVRNGNQNPSNENRKVS